MIPYAKIFDVSAAVHPVSDYQTHHYAWDFGTGDTRSFKRIRVPRSRATGHVAATVFERVGTFNVDLTTTDHLGAVTQTTQSVAVDDANVTTLYVSFFRGNDSNNGTIRAPLKTFDAAMTALFSTTGNRRVLFARGETWNITSGAQPSAVVGNYHIGAYGSGAMPTFRISGADLFNVSAVDNVRISDVSMLYTGSYPPDSGKIGVTMGESGLVHNCKIRGFYTGVHIDNDSCVVSDCDILDCYAYAIYFDEVDRGAVLGCTLDNSINNSLLRSYASHACWRGNEFKRSFGSATRVMGKHSPAITTHVCITDNKYTASTTYLLEIGPESADHGGTGVPQLVSEVLVDRNYFDIGQLVTRAIMVWAPQVEVRNNIFDFTGSQWNGGITVTRRGALGNYPSDVRIQNNTVQRLDVVDDMIFVGANTTNSTIVRNNIVYCPAVGTNTVAQGTVTANNNVTANPQFTTDWMLSTSSPARGAGDAAALVREDFARVARGATNDAGAMAF